MRNRPIRLTLLVVATTFGTSLFGTSQVPDVLVLSGEVHAIYTNPLEGWLQSNPERLPKNRVRLTTLWRGCLASWEVAGHRLFLTDVELPTMGSQYDSAMKEMFPGQDRVFADWFSGHIIISRGKLVDYVHMGYASTYKKYIILQVEQGVVSRKRRPKHAEYKRFQRRQFEAFKHTDECRAAFAESKASSDPTDAEIETFLFEYYSGHYTSMLFDTVVADE